VILTWRGIALFEHLLRVPATQAGHAEFGGPFTAPHFKIIQERITLRVFAIFSIYAIKEKVRWTDVVAFVLIFAGVLVGMLGKQLAGA